MQIVTFFILLMWSVSSLSQNLVINGDFDDGLNGWTSENATAEINSTDGLPSAPSAQLTTVNGASGRFLSNCIPIDPSVEYQVRASGRVLDGATSLTLVVEAYSDMSCSESSNFNYVTVDSTSKTTWQAFPASSFFASEFGASLLAVRIGFQFGGGAPGDKDTLFDHIDFRVAGSTPVRLQAFGVD